VVKNVYMHLGVFGTGTKLMLPSDNTIGTCYSLPMGSYQLGLDEELNVNQLVRRTDMTVTQIMAKFQAHKDRLPQIIKTAYDKGDYHIAHAVNHLIEPNGDMVWGRMDGMNRPYRSYHWLEIAEPQHVILEVGGYDEQPFMAPRWEVEGVDTYGRGPGMNALPALRQLQLDAMRKLQAKDFLVKPSLVVPHTMGNRQIALFPGSIIAAGMGPNDQIKPAFEIQAQALQYLSADITESRQEVDEYFFADLFMAITNMEGVQPRNIEEIASRNEEKLTQLGPVVDQNQNELLRPAIDRAFGLLDRAGELPPPPEEMDGEELEYEFVGILAQMQKMVGVGSIERGLGFVGNLAGSQPEVMDNIDFDQTINEYFDRIGAPPRMIRPADQVAAIREQRAQQEQMANAAGAMQPVAEGAKAAELLSKTDTGEGASLLQRLIGA
jgi:hypothetical protein